MRIDTWFLGAVNFSQLDPEARRELLFHSLKFLGDVQNLSTPEARNYYRDTYAPDLTDDNIYSLFDNLYWFNVVKIEYQRDSELPSAHYVLTEKGRNILSRGYISEYDYSDSPIFFVKRMNRPARKVPFYHLKYVLASYDERKRHLEAEFESDIPIKWWKLQQKKEEQYISENVIIRGIRSAVEEFVDDAGYSSLLLTEEKPEGGAVRAIEIPSTTLEFRIIDYDQAKTTVEGIGAAPDLFWSVNSEFDISDIITSCMVINTFFKGKAGYSGKGGTLKDF